MEGGQHQPEGGPRHIHTGSHGQIIGVCTVANDGQFGSAGNGSGF